MAAKEPTSIAPSTRDFDSKLTTSFIRACSAGDVHKATRLLSDPQTRTGVDINHSNGRALRLACLNGHSDIVAALLALDGDQRVTTPRRHFSPLALAAGRGHIDIVRQLLAAKEPHTFNVHADKETAFRAACAGGHVDVVRELLALDGARRVDVHACADEAFTGACRERHHSVVRELLALQGDRRVDIAAQGSLALRSACKNGDMQLFRLLLEHSDEHSLDMNVDNGAPLRNACRHGHLELVRALLALTGPLAVDPSAKDYGALRAACGQNKLDVVKELFDNGGCASVDVASTAWHGAFGAACAAGHDDVVRDLLERSAQQCADAGGVDLTRGFMVAFSGFHFSTAYLVLQLGNTAHDAVPKFLARLQKMFRGEAPAAFLQAMQATDAGGTCAHTAAVRRQALCDSFAELSVHGSPLGLQRLPCLGGRDGTLDRVCACLPVSDTCSYEQYLCLLRLLACFAVRCCVCPELRYSGLHGALQRRQASELQGAKKVSAVHMAMRPTDVAEMLLLGVVLSIARTCVWRGVSLGASAGGKQGGGQAGDRVSRVGRRGVILHRVRWLQSRAKGK